MDAWLAAAAFVTLWAFRVAGVDFERFQVAGLSVPALSGGSFPLPSAAVLATWIWLTLVVTALVLLSPAPTLARRVDRIAGNLTYGVYLNHFIVAALILPTGLQRMLTAGTVGFGLVIVIGSALLAGLTFALVEWPFERVRAQVRGVDIAPARPAPRPAFAGRWITVGSVIAACLAVLVGPGIETVERCRNRRHAPAVRALPHPLEARGVQRDARRDRAGIRPRQRAARRTRSAASHIRVPSAPAHPHACAGPGDEPSR